MPIASIYAALDGCAAKPVALRLGRSLRAAPFMVPLLLGLGIGLSACGSNSAAKPVAAAAGTPAEGASAGGSPSERCLAVAGAKHVRKPDAPAKIGAKHILVKYAGAKRAPASVTRTREEACLRAQEARTKLESGTAFSEVVAAYSEEQGAASREGSLGSIAPTDVVPPFADAAFELEAGQVSQVVESDYGFHVILRTE